MDEQTQETPGTEEPTEAAAAEPQTTAEPAAQEAVAPAPVSSDKEAAKTALLEHIRHPSTFQHLGSAAKEDFRRFADLLEGVLRHL